MMLVLRLQAAFAAIAALQMYFALPAQAATTTKPTNATTRVDIDIRSTNATAFLVTMADVTNTALVVDGYFSGRRIDLLGSYENVAAVFKVVAERLGASLQLEQGVYVLNHSCTPTKRVLLPLSAALKQPVSIHFQSLDKPAGGIKDIAKQASDYIVQLESEGTATGLPSRPEISGAIGVHFRNVELKKVLELMSYVAGYTLTAVADRRLELQVLPRDPDCAKPPDPLVKQVNLALESSEGETRKKEYLERFPIERARLTGRLTAGGVTSALVQLDHGRVTPVKVGNYMGENYGRVQAIAPDGVTVKEILKDAEGTWYERNRFIQYHAPIDDSGVKPVPAAIAAQFREDAQSHMRNDEFAKAIKAATKAIELDPDNVLGYFRRSLARSALKDHAGAINDAERAVALEKSSLWYEVLASAKHAAGKTDSAIADLTKAIELETDPSRRDEIRYRQSEYAKHKNR
jgi:tetratricopeptide (TPR) repeat protein